MNNRRIVTASLLVMAAMICCTSKPSIDYPDGGYAYVKDVKPADTSHYFLPLRDSIPVEDSLLYVEGGFFFKSFHEKNLSIKYEGEDVFRLSIDGTLRSIIIVIKERELILKQHVSDLPVSPYPEEDPSLLSEEERMYYYFLQKHFPYTRRFSSPRRQYVDSMLKEHPFLRNPAYYRQLKEKATVKKGEPFLFTTTRLALPDSLFNRWVRSINGSGYWQLPFKNDCIEDISQVNVFILEANTSKKYNMAVCPTCYNSATQKLKKACQQILEYAGIDKDLVLWRPNQADSLR